MFHDPGPFKSSVNQAGPSGTRILSLPQHDLRRETSLVSTCCMAAAKVVEEESGISRQRVSEQTGRFERSV
jgi:hypothetical protein